jgi:DNA-binding CsgD family transcriptional regulator
MTRSLDVHRGVASISGQFYDGILEPTAWHGALDAMRDRLGAAVFHYFTLDSAHGHVPASCGNLQTYGLSDSLMDEYEQHHAANDLRMAVAARMSVGEVMLDHEHLDERVLSRNSVYADWLVPAGVRHTAAVTTRIEDTSRDFMSFMRPTDAPHFNSEQKLLFEMVMPDLQRAAVLRARLKKLADQALLGLTAMNSLPQAIMLVAPDCHVGHVNPAADALLKRSAALAIQHGRLRIREPSEHSRLEKMVLGVTQRPAKGAGVFQCGHSAERRIVTVLPLKEEHPAVSGQRPLALVVLTDPTRQVLLESQQIAELLGLSPAEGRLALLLGEGKTIKDFALIEGTSWHTARSHCKNLLRKTGSHRQVDLVSLLQSIRLA